MPQTQASSHLTMWIESVVAEIVAGPNNAMGGSLDEPAWASALIGYANGADPIFASYKEHVGAFHMTPVEIHNLIYPEALALPEQLTVISYILPQTAATKADSRERTHMPPERWARSRIMGEEFNKHLRTTLATILTKAGYPAISPVDTPHFGGRTSPRYANASTWSERHMAHAAGLGTFGLCDGLITPVGKAMRTGSVVAQIDLPVKPRPYDNHRAWCLYYAQGTCGECIDRCPAGALSPAGHDKGLCGPYVGSTRPYVLSEYGFSGYGCGFCQTGVPCESGIPEGIKLPTTKE